MILIIFLAIAWVVYICYRIYKENILKDSKKKNYYNLEDYNLKSPPSFSIETEKMEDDLKPNETAVVEKTSAEQDRIDYTAFYKRKQYLMSYTELKFYKIILEIAKEFDLLAFSQVALYEIIDVLNNQYRNSAFNKIRSKSIDFVLVNKYNCEIKVCIELDDYTHHRNRNRIERDRFVNELFYSLEIPLLRIDVANSYSKELLMQKIKESL